MPVYPLEVRIAGWTWFVGGVLYLVLAVVLALAFVEARASPKIEKLMAILFPQIVVILIVLFVLIGIALVLMGVRTVRGIVRDPSTVGIISIVLGGITLPVGIVFIVAGLLALHGRDPYQAWHQSRNVRKGVRTDR